MGPARVTNDQVSLYLNGIVSEDFYQVDLTAGYNATEKLYFGLNTSLASDNFYGAAIYTQYATTDDLTIGARFEYFSDEGIELLGENENVIDFTLSANYTIGSLTIIPEYRIDVASQNQFSDGESMEKSLSSFILAVVYGF